MSGNGRRTKVLYVDASIGFGGSSKSLALTLEGLPAVEPLMATTQDPEIFSQLFGDTRHWRFRKRVNYRTRWRLMEFLRPRGRLLSATVSKLYALVDLSVSGLTLLKFLRIIRQHQVDIVHLNNGYLPREALLAAKLSGVPVIVHFRGYFEPPIPRSVLRGAAQATHTIAVSDAAIEHLKARIPDLRVTTVYDPVDTERMAGARNERARIRSALGVGDSDVLVGIFGRVVRWKGQLEFVKASIQAMEEDPRLMAVIVGNPSDGSEGYFNEVRELIAASAFADRFLLPGYQPDVEAYYHAIDIGIHASTSPEPFGMVIPEAMAAGRPVIVADLGGPREIVTHGVDGLRVPPGDVTALRDAILELSRDPEVRKTMGERGRQTVAERFTIDRNAGAVHQVYQDVLGNGTAQ